MHKEILIKVQFCLCQEILGTLWPFEAFKEKFPRNSRIFSRGLDFLLFKFTIGIVVRCPSERSNREVSRRPGRVSCIRLELVCSVMRAERATVSLKKMERWVVFRGSLPSSCSAVSTARVYQTILAPVCDTGTGNRRFRRKWLTV